LAHVEAQRQPVEDEETNASAVARARAKRESFPNAHCSADGKIEFAVDEPAIEERQLSIDGFDDVVALGVAPDLLEALGVGLNRVVFAQLSTEIGLDVETVSSACDLPGVEIVEVQRVAERARHTFVERVEWQDATLQRELVAHVEFAILNDDGVPADVLVVVLRACGTR
jgi:hypothetical protein